MWGELVFDYVMLCYCEDSGIVLDDISFVVRLGMVMVIVGCFGSGKISLIWLVLCFYEFSGGVIIFDGVVLDDYLLVDLCW